MKACPSASWHLLCNLTLVCHAIEVHKTRFIGAVSGLDKVLVVVHVVKDPLVSALWRNKKDGRRVLGIPWRAPALVGPVVAPRESQLHAKQPVSAMPGTPSPHHLSGAACGGEYLECTQKLLVSHLSRASSSEEVAPKDTGIRTLLI